MLCFFLILNSVCCGAVERCVVWRAMVRNALDTGPDSLGERQCRWLAQPHDLDNFEAKHEASEDRKTVGGNESNVTRYS